MRRNKEDALFRTVVSEAAKDKSAALEQRERDLNREPIPEASWARFSENLDKAFPADAKRKKRFPRKVAAVAIACAIVLAIVLIPATSQAARRRISELIKKAFPGYTEYQLDVEVDDDGQTRYAPTYIPDGYVFEPGDSDQTLSYRNAKGEYLDISIHPKSAVVQINTENAFVEPVAIGEESGEYILFEDTGVVIWSTEDRIFVVDGKLEKEELLKIARGILPTK